MRSLLKGIRLFFGGLPIVGGLIDCGIADHWSSVKQTFVVVFLSTMPIWFGAVIVYATGGVPGFPAFRDALHGTVEHGALFTYGTSLLAPIFWMALVDPPGAKEFPSKLSQMVVIAVINIFAAGFFGLGLAKVRLIQPFTFKVSVWIFLAALSLRYLGTVYHTHRLPDNVPDEFKKEELRFAAALGEHRR